MEWNNDKGNMELLQHWLDTGQLPCEESEDDLSIHYTNYFKFHKDEDDQYDCDRTVSLF